MFKQCCCQPIICFPYANGTRPPRVLVTVAGYVASTDCPNCAASVNGSYILDSIGCTYQGYFPGSTYVCTPGGFIVAGVGFLFQRNTNRDELLVSFPRTFGTNTSDLYYAPSPPNNLPGCGFIPFVRNGDYTTIFTGSQRVFIAGECDGTDAVITVESLWT